MAKKKQIHPKGYVPKKIDSQQQQERCYIAAKKLLRHFELDPELIDVFSKKQKIKLFTVYVKSPVVKPEKEGTLPRQYVKNIYAHIYQFMINNFLGNPENQLTYMELAIYGMSFILNLSNLHEDSAFAPGTPQEEAAKQIFQKFDKEEVFYNGFLELFSEVRYKVRCYSKVNFRLYGFKYTGENSPVPNSRSLFLRMKFSLTVQDCESKKFIHNNVERKAFRVLITDAEWAKRPIYATVKRSSIFPNTKKDDDLNIYIQSHALQRFKERVDVFNPESRNYLLQYSLIEGQTLISNEKYVLFACTVEEERIIGYFTFFVQGSDIVIKTFLPLISESMPEGKKLYELLPLSKEELIYLGMDKLSFFVKVDFEQIPKLKQTLIDADIWQTKLVLDRMNEIRDSEGRISAVDINKTRFVKDFFEKLEEHKNLTETEKGTESLT